MGRPEPLLDVGGGERAQRPSGFEGGCSEEGGKGWRKGRGKEEENGADESRSLHGLSHPGCRGPIGDSGMQEVSLETFAFFARWICSG